MPTHLPPVNGVSWSEAAAEAMHYARGDRVLLDTVSFEHPELAIPLYLVADYTPFEATLESGIPVTFNPAAIAVQDLSQDADGVPVLTLRITGVSGEAAALLRTIARRTHPLTLVHRVYASDEPEGPAKLPVTRLDVVEVPAVTEDAVELRASRRNPIGRGYPAKSYTREEHPGLVP